MLKTSRKKASYIAAVEQAEQAIMLNDFKPVIGKKLALVFGNEVKGVTQEVVNASDVVIEIPQIWNQTLFKYCGKCWFNYLGSLQ